MANNHVNEASVIFQTILAYWKDMGQEERIFQYLNWEDKNGNGIWHYLADTLRQHEGPATLRIARTLLSMDIDFSKRNKFGMSPLSKMLLPSPKWQSLNALIQTKHLTIENIEQAIVERAKEESLRNHLMSVVFSSDIDENRGLLSQHVLKQAVQPQADAKLRAATCRLFFDYVDVETGSTAFFRLITIANHAMFDDLMHLLMRNTAETVANIAVPDTATRKGYAQVYLAKKLLRRDLKGEGVLFKALRAGKHMHMRKITSLLYNDIVAVKVAVRGDMVRKEMVIQKDSPAPCNPLLSLLLQRNGDGDSVLHHAVWRNDLPALKGLISGLAPNDVYAVIKSFPNHAGLTLLAMATPALARTVLGRAVGARLVAPQKAAMMLKALSVVGDDVRDFLNARVKEVEELAESVGRREPLPPTFQLPKMSPISSAESH
ncbi:hypothetical protein [Telmatospirillum sp.]|uniref:hypothetical protein n=1 Tax=Telmatospirillum sp. TaxID=2079197 RepID=UPI00284638A1|nr:hypothetical protein [Telmatospirillum sp.]MDR3436779.1 hypothetical protein [Telmatospirillum sp.]